MTMAYNGFPATYQPVYYQPQYQPMPPAQQPLQGVQQPSTAPQQSGAIIWVQGEAGAKSYLVAPNTTVQLWDSEAQTIYLKSADASGMPSMKVLDYTIRDQAPANIPAAAQAPAYATQAEITALAARIDELKAEIDSLTKGAKANGKPTVSANDR